MTYEEMMEWLKKCEVFKDHPYMDSVGKVTIGYGRNLDDVGISELEADILLKNDLNKAMNDLKPYAWYVNQPICVQDALINMCFNVGLPRLLMFYKMIDALLHKDYKTAAMEALNSHWAIQVGHRAKEVADLIRQGEQDAQRGAG